MIDLRIRFLEHYRNKIQHSTSTV